jgi:hypothetical protein
LVIFLHQAAAFLTAGGKRVERRDPEENISINLSFAVPRLGFNWDPHFYRINFHKLNYSLDRTVHIF